MVRPEGIEPPAYRFEACRSIHLSYGREVSRLPHFHPRLEPARRTFTSTSRIQRVVLRAVDRLSRAPDSTGWARLVAVLEFWFVFAPKWASSSIGRAADS